MQPVRIHGRVAGNPRLVSAPKPVAMAQNLVEVVEVVQFFPRSDDLDDAWALHAEGWDRVILLDEHHGHFSWMAVRRETNETHSCIPAGDGSADGGSDGRRNGATN